jgi:acyl carrier protein phosphodiesterase
LGGKLVSYICGVTNVNFLAHIFLSGDDPERMVGNFIADHVKGAKKDLYPEGIRKGIELHRAIDHFTDTHAVTAESRRLIRDRHAKYAGVVIDLYYDHFLAADFTRYSEQPLRDFAARTYDLLSVYEEWLPETVKAFLPYMVERDWLTNYGTVEGIGRTLSGLSKRVRFPNRMHEATEDLHLHYATLEADFRRFFPELITFVDGQ